MGGTISLRRYRATLAGLAVLGLGAAGTLALWSDSEFAFAPFSALGFAVESATAATGPFNNHSSTDDAAVLDFPFPQEGLRVGEPVETEFWLRMASGGDGTVQVLSPEVEQSDLAGLIDVAVTQAACGSPGPVLQQGTLDTLGDATETFTLPGETDGEPGQPQPVCITATLDDVTGLRAGDHSTGQVVWEFLVTEEVE